jgi:crotonobetainyl-CoA:carnitine CoA-transferase CaiB-like acyl-CoA transferase
MSEGLLEGLTIIDLTEGACAFSTKHFADFGARVIKIERQGRGDPGRRVGPFSHHSHSQREKGGRAGALFLYLNTRKESVTLDITTASGRQILLDLVEHADALIESRPPGELDSLGLGEEALHNRNPRLVVTSVTAFGQSGPQASWKGSDIVSFSSGGQQSLCGDPGREPLMTAGHQAIYQASMHAFGASLAGLYSIGLIDTGQHIDISTQECLAATCELYLGDFAYRKSDILSKRRGNTVTNTLGIFPCADGYVGVHIMPRNFESFARVIESEWILTDERFKSQTARLINNDEMLAMIYAWTAERSREEIYRRAGEERSTIAPVLSIPEVIAEPHMVARKSFHALDDPRAGKLTFPGPPFRAGEGEWSLRPAPRLGEHTEDVLCGLLDLTRCDLVHLRQAGVV